MADIHTWEGLFKEALKLIDEIETHGTKRLHWTLGGGTVLMLRYQHRLSKDIDIFVPDPQALNYVNPRINSTAEDIALHYDEASMYVKLYLKEGEIDFVASPNLTEQSYVKEEICGRTVKVETSAEIIAKKFFHRGDRLMIRDMFDFALVAEKEPDALIQAKPFLVRNADAVIQTLEGDLTYLQEQFNAIEKLSYVPTFTHVRDIVIHQMQIAKQ